MMAERQSSPQGKAPCLIGSVQKLEMGGHGEVFITNERGDGCLSPRTPGIKERGNSEHDG